MENNINESQDTREESSLLPLGHGSGFSTPPSYFDHLPSEIMNRIQSSKRKPSFSLTPVHAIASLAISACIIALLFLFKQNAVPSDIELSDNEIEHVVENPDLYDLDVDAITEEYLSLNISEESIYPEAGVSDDEIRTYLEESSETTNIINEY